MIGLSSRLFALIICSLFLSNSWACLTVKVTSSIFPDGRIFEQLPLDKSLSLLDDSVNSDRPIYISNSLNEATDGVVDYRVGTLYLFHQRLDEKSGKADWIVGIERPDSDHLDEPNRTKIYPVAYVQSWSILPQLYDSVRDRGTPSSYWYFLKSPSNLDADDFQMDMTTEVTCTDTVNQSDEAVFFDSSIDYAAYLSGFYVRRILSPESEYGDIIYSKINLFKTDNPVYLFPVLIGDTDNLRWIFSHGIGVHTVVAAATSPAKVASALTRSDGSSSAWCFVDARTNSGWYEVPAARFITMLHYDRHQPDHAEADVKQHVEAARNIYEAYREHRILHHRPTAYQQPYYSLRNGLLLPAIGLGTGGIPQEQSATIFREALYTGYRLFDSAREYGNEWILGEMIADQATGRANQQTNKKSITRDQVFLETKIWPTNHGFANTLQEIIHSSDEFRTTYIDLYLIHWPFCNTQIDWMHCETTVDREATWQETYRALEKAYAEGYLLSIGVSNFDVALLDDLAEMSLLFPHVVQNYAAIGGGNQDGSSSLDKEVRNWCEEHYTIYQPYASIRNVQFQERQTRQIAQRIARRLAISEHAVSLKFFLQSGAAIIPRATKINHLIENLNVSNSDYEQDGNFLTEDEMKELGWEVAVSTATN